jgi:hypothetical protein
MELQMDGWMYIAPLILNMSDIHRGRHMCKRESHLSATREAI